ncbi:MAG TPA: NUMOD4 domain-containing protein [Flavobacterium sp.]|nr:NUMOD4 domain-containing protein [Flavobacterium sp.]
MEGFEEYQDMGDDFWNNDYSDEYYNLPDLVEKYEEEKYVFILGFDDKYQISNRGEVKSLWNPNNSKHLSTRNSKGWPKVDLIKYKNEIRISLRRSVAFLVAEAFIENPNNFKYIEFKDGDFNNLNVENLIWVFEGYKPSYELIPYTKMLPPMR